MWDLYGTQKWLHKQSFVWVEFDCQQIEKDLKVYTNTEFGECFNAGYLECE